MSFDLGIQFGTAVGAGEQLWDNVLGIAQTLQLVQYTSPLTWVRLGGEEAIRYLTDPEHGERRRQQLEQARQIVIGLQELLQAIANDPAFFTVHGAELGRIAGNQSGSWFHEDFMRRSTFMKGQTVGEIAGRVIVEIALMFLGPEEWIARGIVGAGQAVRYSGKLVRAVREFMERIPGLSRLLRRGTSAADEVAGGMRSTGEVVENVGEIGGTTSRSIPEPSHVPNTPELVRGGEFPEEAVSPSRSVESESPSRRTPEPESEPEPDSSSVADEMEGDSPGVSGARTAAEQ
ncbi:hypothetical protein [Haladaptatus sp. NG-SE-30]